MLTTLLVSAGNKVLGAFGQSKKTTAAVTSPPTGIVMRSGTVLEKKTTSELDNNVEMIEG